jgi:cell wall-associated NlpC family hydrolase
MPSRRFLITAAALAAAGSAVATIPLWNGDDDDQLQPAEPDRRDVDALHLNYQFEQVSGPNRTVMRTDAGALVAELTHGSRTVVFNGAARTFTEPEATKAKVVTHSWVHVADEAFEPALIGDPAFAKWLRARIGKPMDDVLSSACDYITDAPARHRDGVRYAGDASFGYLNNESTRDGADFYDYLGIPWTWPDGSSSRPASKWARALDCSGYLRLVFGYRMGMTLHRRNKRVDEGLPRTAYAIAERAPSTLIAEAEEPDQVPSDLSRVAPGDVVFFALHDSDPGLITHCGIVLGRDGDGDLRFVSARERIDGPTFGDVAGAGIINAGFFGDRLRKIIRL